MLVMPIIFQQHQGFIDFVNDALDGDFELDREMTITQLSDHGKIQAVIVFNNHRKKGSIEVTFVVAPKNQVTRSLIKAFIHYVFVQLDLKRVTAFINVKNIKSIAFVERFGFVRDCDNPMKDWYQDGDAYVYGLFRGRCKCLK